MKEKLFYSLRFTTIMYKYIHHNNSLQKVFFDYKD